MKVLVNIPSFNIIGGVTNHYIGLMPYWSENIKYNVVGKRSMRKGKGAYWLPWDIIVFLFKLFIFRPDVVLLNPSLNRNAIVRDFVFLRISTMLYFKTAIMIHGFEWEYANNTDWKWLSKNFNRANLILVLATAFKDFMENNGVTTPIHLITTKVDDRLIADFDINSRDGNVDNILFLSRIEEAKGVYIAVDAFKMLKEKYPHLILNIVGGGTELENVRKYIQDNHILGVRITGALSGNDIIKELKSSQLSIFPSYREGMPATVLESMAFGMPVITRNVGGLPDFFENGEMGYITDSLDPKDFADAIEVYINNTGLTKRTAIYNHQYALNHFVASKVACKIEKEMAQIIH